MPTMIIYVMLSMKYKYYVVIYNCAWARKYNRPGSNTKCIIIHSIPHIISTNQLMTIYYELFYVPRFTPAAAIANSRHMHLTGTRTGWQYVYIYIYIITTRGLPQACVEWKLIMHFAVSGRCSYTCLYMYGRQACIARIDASLRMF